MITIREYTESDRGWMEEQMDIFQKDIALLDHECIVQRSPGFGVAYTGKTLKQIEKNAGKCYMAEDEGVKVGFIIGVIHELDAIELLESIEEKEGHVTDLYVVEGKRNLGIGQLLIEKIEEYFRENDLQYSYIEVFGPNTRAKAFYEKMQYRVRDYVMMKKL